MPACKRQPVSNFAVDSLPPQHVNLNADPVPQKHHHLDLHIIEKRIPVHSCSRHHVTQPGQSNVNTLWRELELSEQVSSSGVSGLNPAEQTFSGNCRDVDVVSHTGSNTVASQHSDGGVLWTATLYLQEEPNRMKSILEFSAQRGKKYTGKCDRFFLRQRCVTFSIY